MVVPVSSESAFAHRTKGFDRQTVFLHITLNDTGNIVDSDGIESGVIGRAENFSPAVTGIKDACLVVDAKLDLVTHRRDVDDLQVGCIIDAVR